MTSVDGLSEAGVPDAPPPKPDWTRRHESVLKGLAERAAAMRVLHDRSARSFQKRESYYAYPILILSAVNASASFTTTYLPPIGQHWAPVAIGAVSTIITLISSLKSFAQISELYASHQAAALQYAIVSRQIVAELAVERADRRHSGVELLRATTGDLDKLLEGSPPVPEKISAHYVKEVKAYHKKLSKPRAKDEEDFDFALPENLYSTQKVRLSADEDQEALEQAALRTLKETSIRAAREAAERIAMQAANTVVKPGVESINVSMQRLVNEMKGKIELTDHKLRAYARRADQVHISEEESGDEEDEEEIGLDINSSGEDDDN